MIRHLKYAPLLAAVVAGCSADSASESATTRSDEASGATSMSEPEEVPIELPATTPATPTSDNGAGPSDLPPAGSPSPESPQTPAEPASPNGPAAPEPEPSAPASLEPAAAEPEPSAPAPASVEPSAPEPQPASPEPSAPEPEPIELEPFSFFVTSYRSIVQLSGSMDGFGGDLRYGTGTGLAGADKICTEIAELSMPGAAAKEWRAFLSVSDDDGAGQVNAIDRIGEGPWFDRAGRLVATNVEGLLRPRPDGVLLVAMDLPNEFGVPNKDPDLTGDVDNHHTMTGSNPDGTLDPDGTCDDWTRSADRPGPRVGLSWPRRGATSGRGSHWMSEMYEAGCEAGVNFSFVGGMNGEPTVGSGGGYGGIYCFALNP